jgi:hypothetical protein
LRTFSIGDSFCNKFSFLHSIIFSWPLDTIRSGGKEYIK